MSNQGEKWEREMDKVGNNLHQNPNVSQQDQPNPGLLELNGSCFHFLMAKSFLYDSKYVTPFYSLN